MIVYHCVCAIIIILIIIIITILATRMATPMATLGSLPAFDEDTEFIKAYVERAKIFFMANSVPEEKQAVVFLSCIGGKTYALLRSLLAPMSLIEATFEALVTALEEHFEPKPNVISQRFHFHQRNQLPTESVAQFIAALRKLAAHCEFGETLNDALHDRLVGELRSVSIQKKLLSTKSLTFAEACDMVKTTEAAENNSKLIQGTDFPSKSVNNLYTKNETTHTSSSKGGKRQPCYRCGRTNHLPASCRFIDSTCHACGKKGHIAPACRSKNTAVNEVQVWSKTALQNTLCGN